MFKIQSSFFFRFDLGDWVVINARSICALYRAAEASDKDELLLRKPRIIAMASVLEAVMFDFLIRAKDKNYPFPYLGNEDIDKLPNVNKDTRFAAIIRLFWKHRLLGRDKDIYDRLTDLREVRNYVHIAEEVKAYRKNHRAAFFHHELIAAEEITEFIFKFFEKNFSRGLWQDYVGDIELPWKEHFQEIPEYERYEEGKQEEII